MPLDEQKIRQIVREEMTNHRHTGIDALQIAGSSILKSPQSSITTGVAGTLTSGGVGTLATADEVILTNMQTRINDLETKLQNLGLLQ